MIEYHYQDYLGEPLDFGNIASMYFVGLRGGVHVMLSKWVSEEEKAIIADLMTEHHKRFRGEIKAITRGELEAAKEKAPTAGTVRAQEETNK